jgi:hypothetical protein
VAGQVANSGLEAVAPVGGQAGGPSLEVTDHLVDAVGQQPECPAGDALLGGRIIGGMQAAGPTPEVFQDVDQIADDMDRHVAAIGSQSHLARLRNRQGNLRRPTRVRDFLGRLVSHTV